MADASHPAAADDVRPLTGRRVVVPRADDGSTRLVERLAELGAEPVVVPLVEIVDLLSPDEVTAALGPLGSDDWVVVTSPRAARAVRPVLAAHRQVRVAAVGTATAAELAAVDLVPARQSAAGLVAEFPAVGGPAPASRVVVVQAAGGAATLVDGLTALGWSVARIDTHESRPLPLTARAQLEVLRADAVVFTSGSQARAWAAVLGGAAPPVVVVIGPQTASDTVAAGLAVSAVAAEHSVEGLVQTLVAALGAG